MDKKPYKLCCALLGHSEDVRAVARFDDGTIVSASRDKTARVWTPCRDGKEYVAGDVLRGHTNFVSSVCVLNPSENYLSSLIITGSNDKHICIYKLGEVEPMKKFEAHKDTVCNLRAGNEKGTFLSSSWDISAKLWCLENLDVPKLILTGHSLTIWCVADLPNKLIVTGSADKIVIVWSRSGKALHKLEGHTDCIRDIAVINDDDFLTCANDATVRHWSSLSGTCLGTYSGHEHYIYSISAVLDGTTVVTSGEDKTVRVWQNGEVDQTILLPTSSVWCVKLMKNSDIVAGSSDGIVRIFTTNSDRYASPEVLEEWERAVVENQQITESESTVKINELPDASELLVSGQKDGETKMINEGGKAMAYSWSASENKWTLIGEVVGTGGNDPGKQLYNGVEYDYVFSVDIQDGIPPLKLPYNKSEDPWHAAQKFIHQHGLSQMFLERVASFIITNSNTIPAVNTSSQFADPFTGGSRYIPGSGLPNASRHPPAPVLNADPFTGSNRYIPEATPMDTSLSHLSSSISLYFPHKNYLKLEQANHSAILEKLKELNAKNNVSYKMTDEKLAAIVNLAKGEIAEPSVDVINNFWKLLEWPDDIVFPILDIARLAVLFKAPMERLDFKKLFQIIKKHIRPDAIAANQMLAFRLLANCFCQNVGEKFLLDNCDDILRVLPLLPSLGSKNNQVAISTFILNLTVALNKYDDKLQRMKVLSVMITILPSFKEHEATFRALVALGTLLDGTQQSDIKQQLIKMIRDLDSIMNILRTTSESSSTLIDPHKKVANCSKQILDLIV
ncbi:hypothetical protein HCN44_004841 [Aphidius gifuensis]|uniref:Phospholipase A-2-activating protein n=1 Tax=Aphidius gifuensis TaxID=684658 RepID=A0A834XVS0_APHGI|nr:phospholipase A-2-activating protein [Aphidius gifuensis]KAF7992497.1 hypothetical protein HCN44_004841 [Aphidius gifuensis]